MKKVMGIKNTPTPWHISGQSESAMYYIVKSECGRTVARVPFYTKKQRVLLNQLETADFDLGDAERIVACVNACEGLNPEAVPDLIESLGQVFCNICGKLAMQPQDEHCAACNPRRAALANAKSRKG